MNTDIRIKPLVWSDPAPPNEEIRYDHITADTPFGRFLVTWKGWKDHDPPIIDETPWGGWEAATDSLDEARDLCWRRYEEKLRECMEAPPAPLVQPAPPVPLDTSKRDALRFWAVSPFGRARRTTQGTTLAYWSGMPDPEYRGWWCRTSVDTQVVRMGSEIGETAEKLIDAWLIANGFTLSEAHSDGP